MSYSEFITIPMVESKLQLETREQDFCSTLEPVEIRSVFADLLEEHVPLALSINTEKARSELIIAPVLVELRKMLHHEISLFSGVDFNIDAEKGLNGVCDFIVSRSPKQFLLTAPIITIVEAKNENIKSGFGQCIAEMYAAKLFNGQHHTDITTVYGSVTTGSSWKFLKLEGQVVYIDSKEYFIDNISKIMGILFKIVKS